jgi:hypothetical protein
LEEAITLEIADHADNRRAITAELIRKKPLIDSDLPLSDMRLPTDHLQRTHSIERRSSNRTHCKRDRKIVGAN